MNDRRYTAATRRQAVARALVTGPNEAADVMGIPRRTVSEWWRDPKLTAELSGPERIHLARELHDTMVEAIMRARAALPHARLGDIARTIEVLRDSRALLLGTPTANLEVHHVDPLTESERRTQVKYLNSLLRRLDAGDIDGVEAEVTLQLSAEREIDRLLSSGEASTPEEAARLITIEGECRDLG